MSTSAAHGGPGWEPALHVGAVADRDALTVWVATLPGGPVVVLEGVAASVWLEAVEAPDEASLVARVAAAWDREPGEVAADITAFVADLVDRHLLAPTRPL